MAQSVDIPIYGDAPIIPVSGSTPFGYYDNDPVFQASAPKFAYYAALRLGYPVVKVELQDANFYACLEEAVTTYGKELYEYKIRENYISMEGTSNTTVLNNAVLTPSLGTVIRIADTYGSEAGVGGTTPYYTGSLPLIPLQQEYDLNAWASQSLGITIPHDLEVKRVFYEAPPAIVRFFDPYAGTGTGLQGLMEAFGFGQFSPGINFMLMPINFDVLTIQAIEFNDQIRKSAYSFNIVNNQLRIFPIPTFNTNLQLVFIKKSERNSVIYSNDSSSISNISNVPYDNPTYSQLNSIATRWIFEYGAILCAEVLGRVRGKYQTVPVPGDAVTLNGESLITNAANEKQRMIDQLRATLDDTSRTNQLLKKNQETDAIGKTLGGAPLQIYIG